MGRATITGDGRALLFERLVDVDPRSREEARPSRALTRDALKESIRRELGWLLNTRCPVPAGLIEEARARSVVDYGIPDLSLFAPESPKDHRRLAALIGRTITAFEPRLRDVRVVLTRFTRQTVAIRIDAVLQTEAVTEPVSFPAEFNMEAGSTAEVHEA